jgi:hypothetical protein
MFELCSIVACFSILMEAEQQGQLLMRVRIKFTIHNYFNYPDLWKIRQDNYFIPLKEQFINLYLHLFDRDIICMPHSSLKYTPIPGYSLLFVAQLLKQDGKVKLVFYRAEEAIEKCEDYERRWEMSYGLPYLVVRSLKNPQTLASTGYALKPGSTIKLGRAEFRLTTAEGLKNDRLSKESISTQIAGFPSSGVCRYCLESECEKGDFICSPCSCKGSCQYVHYRCLSRWSQVQAVTTEKKGYITNYRFSKRHC